MLFDRETIELGKRVIKKWEGVCYTGKRERGINDCPYCGEFWEGNCEGCPIFFFSGGNYCGNTIYPEYFYCAKHNCFSTPKCLDLAFKMLEYVREIFVRSLLFLDLRGDYNGRNWIS